jgi:phage terminase large subunit GpA-like protein
MNFLSPTQRAEMQSWVADRIREIPTRTSSATVSEYADTHRILPQGTPRPGPWSTAYTKYLEEIMNCMSVRSPIWRVILAKCAQIGATAAAENILAYFMDECPCEILMISATDALLEKWAKKRLEPLIDSCGFRHKIGRQHGAKKSRASGDTMMSKHFPGGALDMASAQSAPSLRSDSKRVLIRDEVDGAKAELSTGEGNWLDVSMARTKAFGNRKKVFDFSTPTTMDESAIWPEYLSGDQRKYFVPCPLCDEMQPLEWDAETGGMRWSLDEQGEVSAVWYQCAKCEGAIKEHYKSRMLAEGEWRPTSKSYDPNVRSYHINVLYAPPGMNTWTAIVMEWLQAEGDPGRLRAFVNLNLGLPYIEDGERPKTENVIALRGGYESKTIPTKGVLFLTMGIDVQRGSQKDKANPARLEYEICAHGAGRRTWSIDYGRITGAVTNPYEGAWETLNEMAAGGKFTFKREDGREFSPVMTFVDSGDGEGTSVVYEFCERWNACHPSKGRQTVKQKISGIKDEMSEHNFTRYALKKIGAVELVTISTNHYKDKTYQNLKIPRKQETEIQRPGFCAFPTDYTKRYFEMLTAEERLRDGSFDARGRRNEALDCRVMNLCAADFYLDGVVKWMRGEAVRLKSMTRLESEMKINTVQALEFQCRQVGGVMIGQRKVEE